ncbi:MAG: hypothetical protein AB1Z38_04980 [Desulfotignum sp.]
MNDFLHSLRNGQADKPRAPKTRKTYDNSYQYNSNAPRYHSYSNGYQNPRNPNMKRQPIPPGPMGNQLPPEDPGITLLADAIENLTHHVEILIKNQEYMSSIQERTADIIERQAFAIEHIVSHLRMGHDPRQKPGVSPESGHDAAQAPDQAQETSPEASMDAMPSRTGRLSSPFSETTGPAAPVTDMKTKRQVIRKRRKTTAEKASQSPLPDNTSPLLPREEILNIIHTMRDEGATYDQIAKRLVDLGQPTFSGRGEWHAQTIHRLCSRK